MKRTAIILVALTAAMTLTPLAPAEPEGHCGASEATRPPAAGDETVAVWADEAGIAASATTNGERAGFGTVDAQEREASARILPDRENEWPEAYANEERQCAHAALLYLGDGLPAYDTNETAGPVDMQHLRRTGRFVVAEDGRTTMLRGVDYLFDRPGINPKPFPLFEEDFDRMESWGINLLRIRLRSEKSGYFPGTEPEPGFMEELDRIIEAANLHRIYVVLAFGGAEAQFLVHEHPEAPGHEQLKFIDGTENQDHWLDHLAFFYERYRDWPGVVGFDALNEDNSYPPFIHDQFYIQHGHRAALDRIRAIGGDKIYFQEPSGWEYFNLGLARGHDLGDPNRYFCTKWTANSLQGGKPNGQAEHFALMQSWAAESATPLFLCEWHVNDGSPQKTEEEKVELQRIALRLMDQNLVGGARNLYGTQDSNGLLVEGPNGERREGPFVPDLARPWPVWVSGTTTSMDFDFQIRRLDVKLSLTDPGPTELFVSTRLTYPEGFIVTTSDGRRLAHDGTDEVGAHGAIKWDSDAQHVVLFDRTGDVEVTIEPTGT